MNKRIAVFNDLSGLGRCSLIAFISVLSAMGIQPCPVPTAILTAQTGYPSYYLDNYTDRMKYFRKEWKKLDVTFNGICTGYLAHEAQLQEIFTFLEDFRLPDTFLLVDPVMGDDGLPYDTFSPALLSGMKQLTAAADIITPNLTEFALLTDTDYTVFRQLSETGDLSILQRLEQLAQEHYFQNSQGPSEIIITGIHLAPTSCTPENSRTEASPAQIGNLYLSRQNCELIHFPRIGGSYSGTGDLFAACIAGGRMLNIPIPEMIRKTGTFLLCALKDTLGNNIPSVEGIEYEPYLSMLMPSRTEP